MAASRTELSRQQRLRSALGGAWLLPLVCGAALSAGPALAQPKATDSITPSLAPAAKAEPKVLISEVVIKGTEGHPERERLDLAVYDAMATRPGSRVSRSELQGDLSAIYTTGWFADVRIQPVDSPLGVQLVVTVVPNPVLTQVELDGVGRKTKIPPTLIPNTFAADYGKTLNLNALQSRIAELQRWYADQGYSLARISGPTRVSPAGVVQLLVKEGSVAGVDVQFLNKEGESVNDKGKPIKGKTKPWVVTREISIKPGDPFNRRQLEEDIKRLYGTGLFGDVKVTLRPVAGNPGEVTIVLGIVEQSTGSLSGGIGYSQSQGVFGQVQLQDNNLGGRAWDAALNVTYGQFGGLADVSFTDPWIKGDKYRTAFRTKVYLSRDVPQLLQSQNNGYFSTVSKVSNNFFNYSPTTLANTNSANGNPWFTIDGNTVAIQRTGATVSFVRPLNGGDPFKKAPWALVVGVNAQEARPMNFGGQSMPFAVATSGFANSNQTQVQNVICIAYNCQNGATSNQLLGVRVAATMTTLNDPRNPISGNFLSLGTEQFVSVGQNSPTFNRMRASGSHFIPVNWLKFYKGCRPKPGQKKDCNQALAFQLSLGTNVGQLPVYEAFCLGGNNSVRGYYDCDLGVGKSFGEATIEYRFPIFSIISGEVFIDGGTTFNTQANVPGNPGGILRKAGSGSSPAAGLIVTTPVGPLRLEAATQNFTSTWRFNLGVGWKF
ncbi:MAG: BamA/TamA family outer membrane protein [Vulcanococcus sp.]